VDPRRWLEAIGRLGATTSGGPNFAYDLCVDRIPPAAREGLDLGGWEVAFVGSEPVRAETLDRFAQAFAPFGFRREAFVPCYGLAEATLFATGGRPDASPVVRAVPAAPGGTEGTGTDAPRVGCGGPASDVTLRIVDPATRTVHPEGAAGEIWLAGPSIAAGYWGQPEASGETFGARLAGTEEGPFLRTGDLGVMADGELFVTGRLKEVMIVRGRKHHPHDVERTAEAAHPALRPASSAAFLSGDGRAERLVLALEVRREHLRRLPVPEVVRAVRAAVVRGHGLHAAGVVLLRTGSIPKTSSGKIRRTACREALEAGALAVVAEDHHRGMPSGGGSWQRAAAPSPPEEGRG
jgi:acyl-CoA synthetase (AMP-forming)/AMP-acid ligase II